MLPKVTNLKNMQDLIISLVISLIVVLLTYWKKVPLEKKGRKIIRLFIASMWTILVLVVGFNTATLKSKQLVTTPVEVLTISDNASLRLSEAIQFQTVSVAEKGVDSTAYANFLSFLDKSFPLISKTLKKVEVSGNRIYFWEGKNLKEKPIILLAHADVVPVDKQKWSHPPFSGVIDSGFIWGRGALDNKNALMSSLEAVEYLISAGYQPDCTIILAFGKDEEIGGTEGAKKIAQYLYNVGIRARLILDEGNPIVQGVISGIKKPVALLSIQQKGYVDLLFTANVSGGHAATPGDTMVIMEMAETLLKIKERFSDSRICATVGNFLDWIGPELSWEKKIAGANRWLFKKDIINEYAKTPRGNAIIKTTIAPTQSHSGIANNVLPDKGTMVLNIRILPGETIESVKKKIMECVDTSIIKVEQVGSFASNPSLKSPIGDEFKVIQRTIGEIFPETIVVPSVFVARADSWYFYKISENVYNFSPVIYTEKDVERLHGIDERISIEGYKNQIRFFIQLIKNFTQKE